MKGLTTKVYPNKGRLAFDGGLSNKYGQALIEDHMSPDCLNVIFDNGAVETRGGTDLLNTTTVGSFVCDGLYTRHDNAGNQSMVAWFGGTMYTWTGTTFTAIASATSVYSAGVRVCAAEYENYMFFCNGVGQAYKYGGDSDEFTRHGITAPSSGPTATTASTGAALTGEYYYAVTYVNSNLVESDISVLTTSITVATQNVLLSSIPVAPQSFGVSSRHLYRTATSSTTLKRLATISDNTTTTYEDAVADSSLGAEAPSDQGEPPVYSAVIYHQARLFFISPTDNLVWYSELGNPYVVKTTSFLRCGDNAADIPVGLAIYDNSLVVFCKQNPWIVYMPDTTAANWAIQRVRAPYGSQSPFGAFNYNNKLMYPAVQSGKFVGFAAMQGQTITPDASLLTNSAVGSDLQSDRIEPDIFNVQEAYLDQISSIVFKNKAYVTVTYGSANTTNNRIYVYDFSAGRIKREEGSWCPWTGLSANQFTELDGKLYYGCSDATGYVYEMNTSTYNDNGTAINSYFWTKEYSAVGGADENYHKDFRYAQLFYEPSGSYYMGFNIRIDSGSGEGTARQIDLNPGGSLWDTARWDVDDWNDTPTEKETREYLSPLAGKRIQFKFSNKNTANQKFKVLGMTFYANLKGIR